MRVAVVGVHVRLLTDQTPRLREGFVPGHGYTFGSYAAHVVELSVEGRIRSASTASSRPWIQQLSEDVLQVNQGSLYPALYRLEAKGWIRSEWGASENNRRARFYELTRGG